MSVLLVTGNGSGGAPAISSGPVISRFDGAALWAGLTESDRATIGAAALELAAGSFAVECLRVELEVMGGSAVSPLLRASDAAIAAAELTLLEAFSRAVHAAHLSDDRGNVRIPSLVGRICRVCGCSQNDACQTASGSCSWVEEDLCSGCRQNGAPA